MSETYYIFVEGIENGWFSDFVQVVRKDGKIFDFVLPGEKVQPHEIVSIEKLDDIIKEISNYKCQF
ncbi:hypothetical protein FH692_07315 [Streptococcus suis]|uniref:Phage protein n=1 Tax=Streptococcus suis TaxID=1307 RepID=A0A540UUS5_STRSU|nr:hypothetical protein [Streptococcus suis]TQE88248.1 hypothetical protein FH692_07315 [Streptococcus suis]